MPSFFLTFLILLYLCSVKSQTVPDDCSDASLQEKHSLFNTCSTGKGYQIEKIIYNKRKDDEEVLYTIVKTAYHLSVSRL